MFRQMLFLLPDVLCGPFCNSIHKTQLGRNVKCVNLRNSSCQHQMKRVSARVCKVGTFRYTNKLNNTVLIALCYRHERLCDGPTKSERSSSDERRMKHEEGESRL